MKNILKILFVIIGTLVGAGFASGKEIYLFFFEYGIKGILGVFVSSSIIAITIYKVLKICYENKIINYEDFCKHLGFKNMSNIVHIFLLITFFIMISGFSSFLKQEYNINTIIGSAIVVVMCYFTLDKNINGIIKVNNFVIPILIIILVITSTKNLNICNNYNNIFNNEIVVKTGGIMQSVLYASYNCILLIPVVITLLKFINNKKSIIITAIINGLTILIVSFCVYNLLLLGDKNVFKLEMPIIEIVKKYGEVYKKLYIIIIGLSIYTTAISTGYGFLSRWEESKLTYKRILIFISIVALFVSQISFSILVDLLYPILGVVGMIEIIMILRKV